MLRFTPILNKYYFSNWSWLLFETLSREVELGKEHEPNKPAAPNAGSTPRLTIGHYWPGVGETERSA